MRSLQVGPTSAFANHEQRGRGEDGVKQSPRLMMKPPGVRPQADCVSVTSAFSGPSFLLCEMVMKREVREQLKILLEH